MPPSEVVFARRTSDGLTFYLEPPSVGPGARPAVPVVFRDGSLWCVRHQMPLRLCGCLDAPEIWPPCGQNNSKAKEEVAA